MNSENDSVPPATGNANSAPPPSLASLARDACAARSPDLFAVLEAAAVPHWFDARILAELLGTDAVAAGRWLNELCQLSMVEAFTPRDAWMVAGPTRLALRQELAKAAPERWHELAWRAAGSFAGEEAELQIERVYHELVVAPAEAAVRLTAIERQFVRASHNEALHALGSVVEELLLPGLLAPPARARVLMTVSGIRPNHAAASLAEERTREALRLFADLGDEPGRAAAHALLGDQLLGVGRLAEALAEFSAARSTLLPLAQREHEHPEWQRELSAAHNQIGNVFAAQGRLAEALREFEAGKTLRLRLVHRDGGNAGWQRDLAVAYNQVGRIFEAQRRPAEALKEFEAARRLLGRLAEREPNHPGWQQDLASARMNFGRLLAAQGRSTEALKEFEAGLAIRDALAEVNPTNQAWQHELALAHGQVGRIHEAQGALESAAREYAQAEKIIARLLRGNPANQVWRQNLSAVREGLARIYARSWVPSRSAGPGKPR